MAQEIVFIDANIFLELFLDNEYADQAQKFLEKVKNKDFIAYTSDFIIYTCLIQIQNRKKSITLMEEFILFINTLEIEILHPSFSLMHEALGFMKKYSLDFDDALVVSCLYHYDMNILISYDTDFDKVSIIKRKVPE